MIAYLVQAMLGFLLGYSLGLFSLKPLWFWIVAISYGLATINLPEYIIKRIK
jgi:hypothetical protein